MDVDIVFFDAGGTLLHPEPSVGQVYADTGRRFGVSAEPTVLATAFRDAFRRKKRQCLPQDRQWWRDVVEWTFEPFGGVADRDGLFDALYDHFAHADAWVLAREARPTLQTLRRRGVRTGLISNWDDRLPGLLEGLGIAAGLDPTIVSFRQGMEKPDPGIFQFALKQAGVAPDRALMVGDDPEADLCGARAVGMRAVLVGSRFAPPDEIDGLDRLLDLVT